MVPLFSHGAKCKSVRKILSLTPFSLWQGSVLQVTEGLIMMMSIMTRGRHHGDVMLVYFSATMSALPTTKELTYLVLRAERLNIEQYLSLAQRGERQVNTSNKAKRRKH